MLPKKNNVIAGHNIFGRLTSRVHDFHKIFPIFLAYMKHPLMSLEDHWCLYQTLKCPRLFSTNFHNVSIPVTQIIKLYWIFSHVYDDYKYILFFFDCLLELYLLLLPFYLCWRYANLLTYLMICVKNENLADFIEKKENICNHCKDEKIPIKPNY